MPGVLVAKGVSKRFGATQALAGVDLVVPPGEVLGLVGPNGAGKTTFIRIVAGFVRADSGTVRVMDQDPWRDRTVMSKIGIVPERVGFPRRFRVIDFLERACRLRGVPERRAREELEEWNLKNALTKTIGSLSAGMLQRLALSHALLHDPEFIIADEPTSNLDPFGRVEILSRIAEEHSDGLRTFLVTSHILGDLDRVCSSVAFLRDGHLVAQGKPEDLIGTNSRLRFRIVCDDVLRLREQLAEMPHDFRFEVEPRRLVVEVPDDVGMRFLGVLQGAISKGNLRVFSVEQVGTTLEEVFRRIIAPETERGPEE